jgi:hypothetical protein
MNLKHPSCFLALISLVAGCVAKTGVVKTTDDPRKSPTFEDRTYPPVQYSTLDWEELIVMLPFWEISLPWRGGYLSKAYPNGIPDDIVKLPGQGAQCGFDVFRLDRSIVGVITHVEEVEDWHELKILRRVENGWDDLTSELFRGATRWGRPPKLGNDLSITVSDESGDTTHRWRDGSYRH